MVLHALSCFSCVVFSTPLFVSFHFSCSVCVVCDSSISIFGLPLWSIQNLSYRLYIFNMLPKYKRKYTTMHIAFQYSMLKGDVTRPNNNHIMQYSCRDNKRGTLTSVVKIVDFWSTPLTWVC